MEKEKVGKTVQQKSEGQKVADYFESLVADMGIWQILKPHVPDIMLSAARPVDIQQWLDAAFAQAGNQLDDRDKGIITGVIQLHFANRPVSQ